MHKKHQTQNSFKIQLHPNHRTEHFLNKPNNSILIALETRTSWLEGMGCIYLHIYIYIYTKISSRISCNNNKPVVFEIKKTERNKHKIK